MIGYSRSNQRLCMEEILPGFVVLAFNLIKSDEGARYDVERDQRSWTMFIGKKV